jgi:dTDP-4-dehydrorhamnose 3,5-epimerase
VAPSIRIERTSIPEVFALFPPEFADARGTFAETYNKQTFSAIGIELEFVQDNQSLSSAKGTVRGLHFQIPPATQTKLVRVLRGSALDVAVDLRHGSPTFGKHVSYVLSEQNKAQFLVPEGFAHGFCTLEDDTIVLYKVSTYYSPSNERGLRWNDSALGIDWGISQTEALLAPRDREFPSLRELPRFFEYGAAGGR